MSTYRNQIDDSDLIVFSDGALSIVCDRPKDQPAFTPRPDDRPAIALDVLGEVERESGCVSVRSVADGIESDAHLTYIAYRALNALSVRRERATKAEAEAKEAEAQLNREAEALYLASLRAGTGEPFASDYWRAVARKARDLHTEAGK